MKYLYLHGFGSGPNSTKAKFFEKNLSSLGLPINVLNLNGDSFSHLLLSHEFQKLQDICVNDNFTLIGSSLGGLLSLNLAEVLPNIKKLILLAPALQFNSLWDNLVGVENMQRWQDNGVLPVYSHEQKRYVDLHYNFLTDFRSSIKDSEFKREISSLVFHGFNDNVIPYHHSIQYAKSNQLSQIELLHSDHSLENSLDRIWNRVLEFIKNDL